MNRVLISVVGLAAVALQPVLAQSLPEQSGDLAADLLPPLTVVADHGGEPARPYYVAIGMAGVSEEQGYVPDAGAPVPISERDMLPVVSERMSPGLVQARSLDLPAGTTPFFLVGDDDLSEAWLAERGEFLRELNAVGLVVQVQDLEGLEQLRVLAQGLEMRPVSGDDLAGRLGLSHYPALITATGIEQ
ncbi:integrating conjugative element protein [Billgrantia ethanolica]|uniref:Integrating conjugative element protein n=1 Tax=Billgrantia ethanolica TaxID=2733486 RepID=A0ABS9AB89_9GAMM|nr:integrating conjugative element protein [Halomonas ethanolica]MCE8005310.1 integrating conjugative element protein [Halomonas ethanolica]